MRYDTAKLENVGPTFSSLNPSLSWSSAGENIRGYTTRRFLLEVFRVSSFENRVESFEFRVTVNLPLNGTVVSLHSGSLLMEFWSLYLGCFQSNSVFSIFNVLLKIAWYCSFKLERFSIPWKTPLSNDFSQIMISLLTMKKLIWKSPTCTCKWLFFAHGLQFTYLSMPWCFFRRFAIAFWRKTQPKCRRIIEWE